MPEKILIATLGDHPAVVTAMVKALREIEGIRIDILHVLHPQNTGKFIGREGFQLIAEHLARTCQVISEPLDFADPNTTETSITFLQTLAGLLERYQNQEQYLVYLSLAGGRKNMSASMALVTQFFPSVRGLYHLLDKREDTRDPTFPSTEEMELTMSRAEVEAALDPPLENLNLVPIPYPGAFASSSELWRALKEMAVGEDVLPLALTPEAELFYRRVFQPQRSGEQLEVWLSQTAYNQYQQWVAQGSNCASVFLTCFKQMCDPTLLKGRMHGTFSEFHFYKRRRTRERPFYYTEPNPIHLYPQQRVERVIICGLSIEQGNGQYEPTADDLLATAGRQPYKCLSDLNVRDRVLLVPLGKAPMVATQTYTLLRKSEEEGRPRIPTVATLYPERHPVIGNGVRLLKRQFKRKDVKFIPFPVKGLRDVDSEAACKTYLKALLDAIEQLRQQYPDRQIALSLSGGRKGMSVLAFFAAQRVGIERVYHTLIADTELEKRIEDETSLTTLSRQPTDEAKASRLFLDEYDRSQFELFAIPVIPLEQA